ncbi:unnamed protein product [Lymnaea stagnalis]|uniref:Uncharacterized protein n=1 Tax=Lymnaea stagnalis TaxID=6523 RepID=A0AAV2HMM5_LYMST
MGNICDCDKNGQDNNGVNPRTPLLSGNSHHTPITREPSGTATGQSARSYKPEKSELISSLEELSLISLARIQSVPSLDKTFQDHGKLYNDLYSNFVDLRKCLNEFKAKFEADTAGIPTITECLKLLAKQCGNARLIGSRTKNCIQITYDKRYVSQNCEGQPEEVLETLELYNKANKLIKNLLDKAPQVKSSITLVLEEEHKLKREVTKADPDGKLGPEPLKLTSQNFIKLHKIPTSIDTINNYTSKAFKEIVSGSKILFEDT